MATGSLTFNANRNGANLVCSDHGVIAAASVQQTLFPGGTAGQIATAMAVRRLLKPAWEWHVDKVHRPAEPPPPVYDWSPDYQPGEEPE